MAPLERSRFPLFGGHEEGHHAVKARRRATGRSGVTGNDSLVSFMIADRRRRCSSTPRRTSRSNGSRSAWPTPRAAVVFPTCRGPTTTCKRLGGFASRSRMSFTTARRMNWSSPPPRVWCQQITQSLSTCAQRLVNRREPACQKVVFAGARPNSITDVFPSPRLRLTRRSSRGRTRAISIAGSLALRVLARTPIPGEMLPARSAAGQALRKPSAVSWGPSFWW